MMYTLKKNLLLILFSCMLLITGCMVGPNFTSPNPKMPSSWMGIKDGQAVNVDLAHWWLQFNDPNLNSLINRAVAQNLTLKQAESRIRQARYERQIASAGLWPTLNANGQYRRFQTPGTRKDSPKRDELWSTSLDATWELDVFGGIRRSVESAQAHVQFAIEDKRDVMVSLIGEVALNYIDLRGFQQSLLISNGNLDAQQKTLDLTRQLYKFGMVSELDVANAEAQVGSTASQIPTLEILEKQTIYNLSVLLGLQPAGLVAELSPAAQIPYSPPNLPTELPSDLLRRRPDIRKAEAEIHSAMAKIGVAESFLYPKFNLLGSAGFAGTPFDSFLSSRYAFWSIGPSIDWPIFTMGSIRAFIDVQKSLTEQSSLAYENTVLSALRDVESALVACSKEQDRYTALQQTVAANQKAVDLSTQLYKQGQIEFLNVLDAQRRLYASQLLLTDSTRDLSTNLVTLYKALGGGWEEEPDVSMDKPKEKRNHKFLGIYDEK